LTSINGLFSGLQIYYFVLFIEKYQVYLGGKNPEFFVWDF